MPAGLTGPPPVLVFAARGGVGIEVGTLTEPAIEGGGGICCWGWCCCCWFWDLEYSNAVTPAPVAALAAAMTAKVAFDMVYIEAPVRVE
jgi:hypothetical protein